MRITLDHSITRFQMFVAAANEHLMKGNTTEAYALSLTLCKELADCATSLNHSIVEPLAESIARQATCQINQMVIKAAKKKGRKKASGSPFSSAEILQSGMRRSGK